MKWLSAGRTELGDPFDSDVSNVARVAEIQSKQFAAMVRRNMSDTRTYGWKHYNPSYEFKEDHGTSHMSALDSEGMAVALTTTVNLYFGARICDPETGKATMEFFSPLATNPSSCFDMTAVRYIFAAVKAGGVVAFVLLTPGIKGIPDGKYDRQQRLQPVKKSAA